MLGIRRYLEPSSIQGHNQCTITMKNCQFTSKKCINFSTIIWTSASTDVQTGTSLIQSQFGFNALGSGDGPPMNFS